MFSTCRNVCLYCILLVCFPLFSFSQYVFDRTLTQTDGELIRDMAAMPDGGFMVVLQVGTGRGSLLRMDREGNILWSRRFNALPRRVKVGGDGNCYVGGNTSAYGAGGTDPYLMKWDSSGNLKWFNTYGTTANESSSDMDLEPDDKIFVGGGSGSTTWIMRVDTNGQLLASRTISGNLRMSSVTARAGGGYYLGMNSLSQTTGNYDRGTVFRLNSAFLPIWGRYLSLDQDAVYIMTETADGELVVSGTARSQWSWPGPIPDYCLRIRANGSRNWGKLIYPTQTQNGGVIFNEIMAMPDSSVILAGMHSKGPQFFEKGTYMAQMGVDSTAPMPIWYAFWDSFLGDSWPFWPEVSAVAPGADGGFVVGIAEYDPMLFDSTNWKSNFQKFGLPNRCRGFPGGAILGYPGGLSNHSFSSTNVGFVQNNYSLPVSVFNQTDTLNCFSCVLTTVSNFSYANLPTTTSFTDNSQYATSWTWDFGDGSGSSLQNPTHTYASFGSYTVCLIATGACNADTICQTVQIGCPVLQAGYASTSTNLSLSFSDQTAGMPNAWSWDFGDGGNSNLQNPMHSYAMPGTYNVCLTVGDSCSLDSVCNMLAVTCSPGQASFSQVSNSLTATFTDSTSGMHPVLQWAWDFGDGATSNLQNPVHTYANPGTYNVCLTIADQCGMDTFCTQLVITCPAPQVAFSHISNLMSTTFTDMTTSVNNSIGQWTWDFGDGQTSSLQNPVHVYTTPGVYTVCLTVTDSCGTATHCDSVSASCPVLQANFQQQGSFPVINFFDQTVGTPLVYSWDFGDGSGSFAQNAIHAYNNPGSYTVCLAVTDSCSWDTFCAQVDVLIGVSDGLDDQFRLYPNPSTGRVVLEIAPSASLLLPYEIYNSRGEYIIAGIASEQQTVLDLRGIAKGLYIVRLRLASGDVFQKLILE